ncbi:GNAT family N-acetyltransferase [Alkalicoccus chagannorensis]|uniref:GNAT family N-acetyltransferase n=1 Tax=Alkalicoccus chagannorensis TaxID=427072 RepID=UPI0004089964|nr:GNAT family protein [Alkalicoccus chagannorensis]
MRTDVMLDFYEEADAPLLADYALPKEQQRYASLPLQAIRDAEEIPGRYPVLIRSGGQAAGFFLLDRWPGTKAYTDDREALLLRSYSIQTRYQGMGMAGASLAELPAFVRAHFPACTKVLLAVNEQNTAAQRVYERGGFVRTGETRMGRKGMLVLMARTVRLL